MLLTPILCLSLNNYFEIRGGTQQEQIMVNKVVIARAEAKNTSYCDEVFKVGSFSWTKNFKARTNFKTMDEMVHYYGIKDRSAWSRSIENSIIALETYSSRKDSKVIYYHDSRIQSFNWNPNNKYATPVVKTKSLTFYKEKQ